MSGSIIENEALKLSAVEKAQLIDTLWQSLDPADQKSVDRAWLAESHDRLEAFRAGRLKSLDGETILQATESDLNR